MHEFIVAQQVVRAVLVEARRRGASEVRSVDLEVGVLEGLSAEGLRRAFELEAEGTALAGAHLAVAFRPAVATCPRCNSRVEIHRADRHAGEVPGVDCPQCRSPMRVDGGRGYVVRSADLLLAHA